MPNIDADPELLSRLARLGSWGAALALAGWVITGACVAAAAYMLVDGNALKMNIVGMGSSQPMGPFLLLVALLALSLVSLFCTMVFHRVGALACLIGALSSQRTPLARILSVAAFAANVTIGGGIAAGFLMLYLALSG